MGKDVVGFRVRRKVRKRLKRIAWEERTTVSSLISNILTDYVRGELCYENDEDPEPLPLSERADNASLELDSILSDVQTLELDSLNLDGTIQQAAKDLEDLAEGVRGSGVEDDTWNEDEDEDEDEEDY